MKCWASLLTVNLERCSTVHLSKKSESFSNIWTVPVKISTPWLGWNTKINSAKYPNKVRNLFHWNYFACSQKPSSALHRKKKLGLSPLKSECYKINSIKNRYNISISISIYHCIQVISTFHYLTISLTEVFDQSCPVHPHSLLYPSRLPQSNSKAK